MKLIVTRNQIGSHPEHFLRQAGYAFIRDRERGKESYVRRLSRDFYPRLHMYIEQSGEKIVFDLHLDQKQASYAGARMHNAEHEGPVVENEIERLRELVGEEVVNELREDRNQTDSLEKIGHGDFTKVTSELVEKKWWRFW